jgi:hypothetical protein
MSGEGISLIQCMVKCTRTISTQHLSYRKVCVIDYFCYLHICIYLFVVLFKWYLFVIVSNPFHYWTKLEGEDFFFAREKNARLPV